MRAEADAGGLFFDSFISSFFAFKSLRVKNRVYPKIGHEANKSVRIPA
jgi:hypothetical protein